MRIGGFDLVLDLKAREQRHVFLVQLQSPLCFGRHEALHVLLRLLEGRRIIDLNLADVVAEIVAQRAGDGIAFLVHQKWRGP